MYELTEQIEELLGQRAKGSSVNGSFLCPLHDERTPSLSVHLETGLWFCFGCGRKGNLERLYSEVGEELDDDKKYELLAKSVYREPDPPPNFASLATRYQRELAGREGQAAWQFFCESRAIERSVSEHFRVGYVPERRALAFPYWNDDGRVTGIKYRFRSGSKASEDGGQRSIYNVTDIIGAPTILLCEGESDTIAAYSFLQHHEVRTVAVCGSPGAGVSEKTWANWGIDFLFARTIYVAFDADTAGSDGAEVAMRVLGSERCVRIVPTRGSDIAEHLKNGGTLQGIGIDES